MDIKAKKHEYELPAFFDVMGAALVMGKFGQLSLMRVSEEQLAKMRVQSRRGGDDLESKPIAYAAFYNGSAKMHMIALYPTPNEDGEIKVRYVPPEIEI